MSTAIEQAIASAIQANLPITVNTIFPFYLQYAGLVSDVDVMTTFLTFERAMDKHPMPPSPTKRKGATTSSIPLHWQKLYHTEVEQLRKDYWTMGWSCEALGSCACACAHCGKEIPTPALDDDRSFMLEKPKKRTKSHKRKPKKRSSPPLVDQYGASTSACCL
ncbi:hypothetical protein EIP91_006038 [Steccherinum ochraceum]|uniref:Uncharacterized protein n=1 Tax=Steccherinum ochraceum TaxID=92696 RepID=A0A4R0R6A9_9APHY|nr:hypothetical protein EIP91_006038 [Steccherinum ochraceum]